MKTLTIKTVAAVVALSTLGACDTPELNAEFEEIRQASTGLINIHTPTNMLARERRMTMEAVSHQVNRHWSADLAQCKYGRCWIDIDVKDVRYRNGAPYQVKIARRSVLLAGGSGPYPIYETYKRVNGNWVIQGKSAW